ncbi:hypothetical protein B9Z65_7123 [Elsinoe australis]|uniref:Major facilitator superfamily (MFS) profile domain-containing protein n=1 Tax=Elsinoe australis TaxID=40998 RepID=A0A2P7Z5Y5_9PEZI|nr:hypothetical protein B9Z65_7123 [Elsinoe australis]
MSIDYAKLREQTLGSGLDEEAVTVNTRALIDKVLARYSGEWTTLRELIQNAADASATKVTIRFETTPSSTVPVPQGADDAALLKHVVLNHTLKRLLVSNNGQSFGENDWARLKRIAEGNPDETKIGAFGVGFYSVFADCETPFVTSGDQTMAFYWKGNSLFTRRGKLSKEQATNNTCFLLDYRNTGSPVPSLLSLCQFLSTSLTFVGLESIELWLDEWNLLKLVKKSAPAATVSIPKEVNPKTKDGLMKIVAVEYQNAQIDSKWMNVVAWDRKTQNTAEVQQMADAAPPTQSLRSFFSRFTSAATGGGNAAQRKAAKEEEAVQKAVSEHLAAESTATVFLRVSTVNVQTYVPKQLAAELERATKKPPPKHTRIAILTSSFDETSASLSSLSGLGSGKANEIFASVLPSRNGRIFIGFPTAQTTGLLAHISAPSVIPTVERESIDLNARYVRTWNHEMLRVAGIACRVAYTGEMSDLKSRIDRRLLASKSTKMSKEDLEAVIPSAIHAFKQYTFQESTPSSQVGQIIEEAFWTCNQKASIDVLSSRGVLPSVQVRLATEDLSFVEGIPVIPDQIVDKASAFLQKLQEYGLLTEITTKDIKKELESQAISEEQLTELLKWAGKKIDREELDTSAIRNLFDGTVATLSEETSKLYSGPVLLLGGIETFPAVAKIPPELPMPPTTIPFHFVKGIPKNQLEMFGWNELQIVPWLRYIIEKDGNGFSAEQSLTTSPAFAAQVLPVLSKGWDALSQSSKTTVVELLRPRTIIPTKLGMRKPPQSYFASVRLFDDLPTIQGLQGTKEKFLASLGVRKTVELIVVFERLMSKGEGTQEMKWSHMDLIKYLVSVRDDIPAADIEKLRKTPICPAEQRGGKSPGLFRVSDLFEPKQPLRDLGLQLLYWPEPFRLASPEAKFLSFLGLKSCPAVPELIDIMVKAAKSGDGKQYETAVVYFIANHYPNGYRRFPIENITVPFLPLAGQDLSHLSTPGSVFTNKGCAVLGFDILREDLHAQASILGVQQDPPINICAERLVQKPPRTRADAKVVFSYFAGRINEIGASGSLAERLGNAPIVPVKSRTINSEKDAGFKMIAPRSCFLGDSQTYGEIFDFVDFGSEANAFLLKIGSKHEPNAAELAQMIVREPARLLNTLGADKYLSLLRRLAENVNGLKVDKSLWASMKKASCLIAVREVSSSSTASTKVTDEEDMDYEDESAIKEYSLASSASIVLVDDYVSYRLFRDRLLAAPQEEVLETFYAALGTPWLGSMVENNQSMGPILKDQAVAERYRKLIIERCRLFLHDHTADAVRHDARWMEKVLQVKATSSLTLRKTLRGTNASHTDKMSAALHRDTKHDATLYITAKADLYEVSRAIMPLLLKRPKQQDYLALEMIMESDLRRLKTKGYNVDRILRQKAAESRIAEAERQRQMHEEEERMAEEERKWKNTQAEQKALPPIEAAAKEDSHDQMPSMPGAFQSSPNHAGPSSRPKSKGQKSFFSNLTKQLGFNNNDAEMEAALAEIESQSKNNSLVKKDPEVAPPPPYSAEDSTRALAPKTKGPEQVTPPHQLQQNLVHAIHASRAHDSGSVFSQPSTQEIKEQSSFCDSRPGQDLTFVADSQPGIKIFLSRTATQDERNAFLRNNAAAVHAFAVLLLDVGSVFLLKPQSLHIFYNETGSSIAFNSNGSLFCNLRFFLQLHWNGFERDVEKKREAAVYWWVTLCHELAHNLVSKHGSQHEYFTESFVTMYFGRMVQKPANIPLHSISSSSRASNSHTAIGSREASFDEKREGLHHRTRSWSSNHSLDSPVGSEFSLWSDTGDLVDQLAAEEDPLRPRGDLASGGLDEEYELAERKPKRGRGGKKVRYQSHEKGEKSAVPPAPKRKEDIPIPNPTRQPVGLGHRLLAAVMAPNDSPSRMHGLHGKKLIYFTSVFVSLGVFLFGYDQGVMSGIITGAYFKDYFNQPTRAEIGTMVAILEVGAFIASLVVGRIGDIIGRRKTILYGAVVFFIGGALQTFATGMPMMLVGRIIAGFGVGALSTIVPVYQSEISPPHNRGKLACIEFTGNITGYAASVWVDYICTFIPSDWSWRVPLLMQCIMGGLLGLGSFLIPESPRWLLDNDHDEEGIVVIANLYGKGDIHNQNARDEYREIKMNVLLQRQEGERSYTDMFKRYYKRVFIAMSAQALAQLNGINVISYYAPLVFEQAGWQGRRAILMTGINSLTYLASTIPPWYLVDRLGRRPILLWGAIAMMLSLSAISYFIFIDIGATPNLVVIFVMIYNAAFGASWGPIPWLYPPEILPLSIRAKGASLSTASNWAFNWLVGEMTPILQELIKWRLYLLHAFFCAVSFVVVWFIYPETANVRLEDMNSLFGDATTAAPTPQQIAEAESFFSGRSPVPSFHLGDDERENPIPNMDLNPPEPGEDAKNSVSKGREGGEGVGGWISNLVKKGKPSDSRNGAGSGKYRRIADDEE